jgi:heme exporter protein D
MDGTMGGWALVWGAVGLLLIVLLMVVIVRLLRK